MIISRKLGIAVVLSAVLSPSAFAAAPVAINDARNIAINSVATINVLANDFDVDGDSLSIIAVTTSSNATISVNGDGSISYVPNTGFSGVDTFSYTIQESDTGALTATATVTVTVVQRDAQNAVGTSRQQNVAEAVDGVCTRLRSLSDAELGSVRRNLLERCNALSELAVNDPDAVPAILRQISPDEITATARVARQFGRTHAFALRQRLDQRRAGVQSFTLNGLPAADYGQEIGGAAGSGDLFKRLGFFASAQLSDSEKETSDQEMGYDADSNSLTFGLDYFLNNKWIIGAAIGLSQGELEFSNSGGELDSEEASILAFGSYTHGNFSYDAQLGYASTGFTSKRVISYNEGSSTVSDTLSGETTGSQLLFNNLIQWTWNKGAYSAYPFLKADFLINDVKGYSEQGNSGLPMTISGQNSEQVLVGLGLQNTYVMSFDWGVWVPSLEIGLNSEINDGMGSVEASFAFDTDSSNVFVIESDGGDTAFWQIGLASSFTFKGGTSAFIQYQQIAGYEGLSSYQLSGGLRLEF